MKGLEKFNFKIGLGNQEPTKQGPPPERRVMTLDQAFKRIDKMNYTPEIKDAIKKVFGKYPANSMERALSRIDEIAAKIFQSSPESLGNGQPEGQPDFENKPVPVIDPREIAAKKNVGPTVPTAFGRQRKTIESQAVVSPSVVRSADEDRFERSEVPPCLPDAGGCQC